LLLDHRIDGVFLTDIEDRDPRFAMLARSGTPAVAVNAGPDCPMPAVRQDHAPGLVELVDRVVALGHRRIAHVSGPPGFIHSGQRERVWREALEHHGIRPGPVVAGDFSIHSGTLAADRLLRGGRSPRPTAVVCANDLMALGFLTRATDLGVDVPGELSVTGFDGIEFGAYARPSLTTVATSPHRLGAASARSLLASIEEGRPEDVEIEPTRLVVRDSLGPVQTA
jgi:DNA-binding LacI/PurR family transcriptional regulator